MATLIFLLCLLQAMVSKDHHDSSTRSFLIPKDHQNSNNESISKDHRFNNNTKLISKDHRFPPLLAIISIDHDDSSMKRHSVSKDRRNLLLISINHQPHYNPCAKEPRNNNTIAPNRTITTILIAIDQIGNQIEDSDSLKVFPRSVARDRHLIELRMALPISPTKALIAIDQQELDNQIEHSNSPKVFPRSIARDGHLIKLGWRNQLYYTIDFMVENNNHHRDDGKLKNQQKMMGSWYKSLVCKLDSSWTHGINNISPRMTNQPFFHTSFKSSMTALIKYQRDLKTVDTNEETVIPYLRKLPGSQQQIAQKQLAHYLIYYNDRVRPTDNRVSFLANSRSLRNAGWRLLLPLALPVGPLITRTLYSLIQFSGTLFSYHDEIVHQRALKTGQYKPSVLVQNSPIELPDHFKPTSNRWCPSLRLQYLDPTHAVDAIFGSSSVLQIFRWSKHQLLLSSRLQACQFKPIREACRLKLLSLQYALPLAQSNSSLSVKSHLQFKARFTIPSSLPLVRLWLLFLLPSVDQGNLHSNQILGGRANVAKLLASLSCSCLPCCVPFVSGTTLDGDVLPKYQTYMPTADTPYKCTSPSCDLNKLSPQAIDERRPDKRSNGLAFNTMQGRKRRSRSTIQLCSGQGRLHRSLHGSQLQLHQENLALW